MKESAACIRVAILGEGEANPTNAFGLKLKLLPYKDVIRSAAKDLCSFLHSTESRAAIGGAMVGSQFQPAIFAASASTAIPTTIRYTAKGANPLLRTQAMSHATLA